MPAFLFPARKAVTNSMTVDSSSFREIIIESSLDGSLEPSLLFLPERPAALVVGLHTWSADRFNQMKMLPFCQERGWALLLPEFRGPNTIHNPRAREAGGSRLARRDIVDATKWVTEQFLGSDTPTFLLGGSGGGHMALLVAAREPFSWRAVSSWCPITDLAPWHGDNPRYTQHIEAVCGGPPGVSEEVDEEYRSRSPITFAESLRSVRLHLAHGRHDISVPYRHSWDLAGKLIDEPLFYLSIFDGKHEMRMPSAFEFFDQTLDGESSAQLTG